MCSLNKTIFFQLLSSISGGRIKNIQPNCKKPCLASKMSKKFFYNNKFIVSAVHFAPYLTGLSSMILIWAAGARCKNFYAWIDFTKLYFFYWFQRRELQYF